MSILIEGMEMPKNCLDCPLFGDEEVYCKAINKYIDLAFGCMYKLRDCPLIRIPPHGRLIDVDAPMRFEITIDGGTNRCVTDIYAPTVIKAEGGE